MCKVFAISSLRVSNSEAVREEACRDKIELAWMKVIQSSNRYCAISISD